MWLPAWVEDGQVEPTGNGGAVPVRSLCLALNTSSAPLCLGLTEELTDPHVYSGFCSQENGLSD